ncbi:MAG: bile acid:sodium symporter [Cellulomonas sp.]|nr:bile acid:sodium symporter [Cellulomonas sp.]
MPDASAPPVRSGPRFGVDPLTIAILTVLVLGLLVPVRGAGASVVGTASTAAIVLLFFLYGVRTSRAELSSAVRGWRLQSAILVSTFVAFPLIGLLASQAPFLSPDLRTGVLYLSLLPSTVQSSIVFTSIARGDVAGAITGATASNLLGIVLTPLLVAGLLGRSGGGLGADAVVGTLTQLLGPFVLGQLVQRRFGPWVRAHVSLTRVTDRATIVLVVYSSVSEATVSGAWSHLTVGALAGLLAVCALVLAAMLAFTWRGGALLGLDRGGRIALLMCGSKKSLATGLPMAAVLFTPAMAASVALPVIVFHQLQLAVCAMLARRLGQTADGVSAGAR